MAAIVFAIKVVDQYSSEMAKAYPVLRAFILSSLANGSFQSERLPAERELADQFALSRAAIRDALAVLETEGLVRRTHGSGTYITKLARRTKSPLGDALDVSPAQVMEARLAIEPQFAELVVANATAADIAAIEEANSFTAEAKSPDEFAKWNGRLHQAIAAATRNEFLIQVFGLVIRAQQHPVWGELRRPASIALRREYQKEHDAIVAGLKARNVPAARAAISEHLRHARRTILG